MKILVISRWFPFPTDNGSKLRVYHLLRGLSEHFEITLISFCEGMQGDVYPPEITSLCREIQTVYRKPFSPGSLKARLGLISLTPRSIIDTYSQEMARRIRSTVANWKPDLIIAFEFESAIYVKEFDSIPALFEEVELGLVYDRYAKSNKLMLRLRNGLTWWKHRRYMANISKKFKACTVVSDNEKKLLAQINPTAKIEVIPNCINLPDYLNVCEEARPNTLIFTGSFNYYPNHEAVTWFLESVYPKILEHHPDMQLVVTGDHANLPLPTTNHVVLTGFVEDVRPLIARSWISLVPIKSGGGTRLKILEAMALHVPVVSTPKGAEGLAVTDGENILIADTADDFSRAILRLVSEPGLRQKITSSAYQLVKDRYYWVVVLPRFIALADSLLKKNDR